MTSDPRAAAARAHHRSSQMHEEAAGRERLLRNQIVKTLRTEDPKKWTYGALADAVGCSEELIRKIISPQRRGQ